MSDIQDIYQQPVLVWINSQWSIPPVCCLNDGFPSLRQSEIKDVTTHLLTAVHYSVETEPPCSPFRGGMKTQDTNEKAHLDCKADSPGDTDIWVQIFDVGSTLSWQAIIYLAFCFASKRKEMRSSLWAIGPRAETWLISPLVFADTLWSHFKCWLAVYKRIVPHSANKYSHPTIPSPSPWKQHTNCRLFAWQSMQLLAKQTNKLYINMQSNYICKYAVNKIIHIWMLLP